MARSSFGRASAQPAGGSRTTEVERSDLENFAEVIAHELRTPLAVVTTASETILAHSDDMEHDKLEELLRVINRNSRLAALLLNRLSLAKDIEQDAVQLSVQRVDLVQLVRDSASDLADVVLGGRTVRVTATAPLKVTADPTAVREIVFNLLSNAAKYSSEGAAIEVHVTEEGERARVKVRDHGAGVGSTDRERIFDEYLQVDPSSPGVGLGLYISRGLARAHGGDLTIDVTVREGSQFILDLPIDGPTASAPARDAPSDLAVR